jgi:two-component system cell cycle sensor histidine kinase/response regulator CckA
MGTKNRTPVDAATLRAQAEECLWARTSKLEPESHDTMEETLRLMHELQVHQIELEMQNEELQTARVELEMVLERYSDLYDFAPVGYLTLDSDGTIQKVNLTGARMLGLERNRLVRVRFGLFIATESLPTFATFLQNAFANKRKESCEVMLRPQIGTPIWVQIEATITGDDGHECRAVVVDVTERRRGEQALQQSQDRFRNLFQSMDEGFTLCEMIHNEVGRPVDFRFLEVNPAFSRQTGLPVEQVLGRTVNEVIPDLGNRWIELYERVMCTGQPERIEGRVESLSRQLSVHAWRADTSHIAAAFSDVTAQRHTEEQLRIAQRMEAIGRLAGGIAHDFNNLLTVILNHDRFALDEIGKDHPLWDHLTEIYKASDRAANLTKQILAFSRKQVLQAQVLDLNQILSGMEGMLRSLLGEGIAFSLVLAMGLDKVMADPGQIEQVVMNLAVNAHDAMPGGGMLTIETANTDLDQASASQIPGIKPGPHVRLSVTDTGCGMDEEIRTQLFEPFFTTKKTGKGTGLGLATVYGIVRQSGGAIWVRSAPKKGTTFTVLFPRELSTRETVAHTATVTTHAVAGETVLVVEDEESVRNLVKCILSRAGYTVLTAANGVEALTVCERQQGAVDLVLTDVVMPEMNGKELSDNLKRLYPNLRVLYMSGYTKEVFLDRGILDRGTHFIGKPFSPADLNCMVRQVLDGERPSNQPIKMPLGQESS